MYHSDPQQFAEASSRYAPIGAAVVHLSNLEFAHDSFVLTFHEKNTKDALKISRHFPRHFKDKVDFLIGALAIFPKLRTVPVFWDGTLNLLWLQYQLDELYEVRTKLAHGSIFYSETGEGGTVWRLDRVASSKKRHWGVTSSLMGSSFLADVSETARSLTHYLTSLTMSLEGRFSWEEAYKTDCEIRENHKFLKELAEAGALLPDETLLRLMRSYDERS